MLSVKDFKQETKYPSYVPSTDETIKTGYVKNRFEDMRQARTAVDKDWNLYQTMINAEFTPYPDERSSSTVPLISSMIELYVADAVKLGTEFTFKSETSEHSTNAKALEYVWKYDWRTKKRKQVMVDEEYICAWFWTSVKYLGFESRTCKQSDYEVGDDMKPKWVEKEFKEEEIIVKNIDIRDFYLDDTVKTSIDDASDCILIQQLSYEKFQELEYNPFYKNIDKVAPQGWSSEDKAFITEEERIKDGKYVKLMHYWNVEKDCYIVIANDKMIIREHPMMSTIDGIKALPFVVRAFWKKNYSIYGRGFCEAGMMFNSELNNLREMLMDAIRRSNQQTIAIGNGLTFDGRTMSYENEIMTFDGNFANNFQQLSGNPPNQAIFNQKTELYKDIAMFMGVDIQNIIWQPQQTAFQTDVQREASQKRINVWLTNRDLANERFADLYKDLLQKYFPRKDAEGLYPVIEIDGQQMMGEWDKKKFRNKKGKSIFEVTPEILRGDISIDVYTNTTAPTINAVDRQQKLDLLNAVGGIAQGYALAKQSGVDIETILPLKKTLRDLASDYNLEVESNADQEDVQDAKKKLMEWLMAKMGGMNAQPTEALGQAPSPDLMAQQAPQPNQIPQWPTA